MFSLNFFLLTQRIIFRDKSAGQVLEVVLAKPQSDKKSDGAYSHIPGGHPNHLLHAGGYGGYGGNPYGSVGGYGVSAGFHQVMCSFF